VSFQWQAVQKDGPFLRVTLLWKEARATWSPCGAVDLQSKEVRPQAISGKSSRPCGRATRLADPCLKARRATPPLSGFRTGGPPQPSGTPPPRQRPCGCLVDNPFGAPARNDHVAPRMSKRVVDQPGHDVAIGDQIRCEYA